MKNAKLLSLVLMGVIFGFALAGCQADNVSQEEALQDIKGDWRITNFAGKNAVADLYITSKRVFCGEAYGYGDWHDEGTYTYDSDTITLNLNNNGSSTYQYWLNEDAEPDRLEIRYISGNGRQLIEGVYYKERPINW